jgi:regulatory protein
MRKTKEASITGYRLKTDNASIITSITYQKRDKLRASVFIAGEFAFGINVATIEKFRLRKGDELSHQLLQELQTFDGKVSAKRIATKFLNTRRRTEKEVREKLRQDFDDEIIGEIINDLLQSGLVNDEAFAAAFIHDKRLSKPLSSRHIENELRRKGIAKNIVATALDASDEAESDEDRAIKIAKKKWEHLLRREPDEKKRKQKLIAFLGSRRFEYDVIKTVLRSFNADLDDE